MARGTAQGRNAYAIAFALVYPTILTLVYFILLAEQPTQLQQSVAVVGKLIQFAFPAWWVLVAVAEPTARLALLRWLRRRILWFIRVAGPRCGAISLLRATGRIRARVRHQAKGVSVGDRVAQQQGQIRLGPEVGRQRRLNGVAAGLAFGGLVLAVMLALYFLVLKPSGMLEAVAQQAQDKVRGLGLNSVGKYTALGVFYVLFHSLLEEYYWRWFAFGQLQRLCDWRLALLVSSGGFMAHHVVLLGFYFGWTSPLTYLFSLGVGVGGAVWAWLYHRSQSLYGPWLSHLLVDLAIFSIGFDLLGRHLGG